MFPQSFFTYTRPDFNIIEEDPKDHFSEIPDELIIKILQWLPQQALGNCAEVSTKFNRLVKDESLWENIDALGKCLTSEATSEIFSRKPLYLRMAKATIADPIFLHPNFTSPQLLYLDLSMAFVEPWVLAKILRTSTSLVKCSLEGIEITTEALIALQQSSATLTTLNFAICSVMDSMSLAALLANCHKLKSLNIGCIQQCWTSDEVFAVIQSIPSTVEQLNFSGFRNLLTDNHVALLVHSVPQVTDLDLSDAQFLTDASVNIIAENLKYVQHLAFSRCYQIKASAYGILAYLETLRHLEIFSIFRGHIFFQLREVLPEIGINECPFSSVARPTIANQRNTIWGHRVKFYY